MKKIISDEKQLLSLLLSRSASKAYKPLVFFSSELDCYTDNAAFMSVPIEDKIINRAYGIFETTKIYGDSIFNLDLHVDRFFDGIAKVGLKPIYSRAKVVEIIEDLAKLSREKEAKSNIDIRFYYSAGLGDFSLNVKDELNTFYCLSYLGNSAAYPEKGIPEFLVSEKEIDERLLKAKTVNYLKNSIVKKASTSRGGYQGIKVDSEGQIIEGTTASIGFINNRNMLVIPPFSKSITGTTALKLMEEVETNLIPKGLIAGIERRFYKKEDLSEVVEAFFLGGDRVVPILSIDEITFGKEAGEKARSFVEFFAQKRKERPNI